MDASPRHLLGSVPLSKRKLQIHDVRSLFKNMPPADPVPTAQTWLNHQDGGSDGPLVIRRNRAVGFQAFASLDVHYLLILKNSFAKGYPFLKWTFLQRP